MALCYHEDRYLAVWNEGDPSGIIGVNANLIFPDGSIADSVGFRIHHGAYTGGPSVTHDRSSFLVSWTEGNVAKLARVSDSGAIMDTVGATIDSLAQSPVLASNGDTTMVVFSRAFTDEFDSLALMETRFDAALNRLDTLPRRLSRTGHVEWGADPEGACIALCGDDYLVAWSQPLYLEEHPSDGAQVLCRRVNRNGELLDSTPAVLSLDRHVSATRTWHRTARTFLPSGRRIAVIPSVVSAS